MCCSVKINHKVLACVDKHTFKAGINMLINGFLVWQTAIGIPLNLECENDWTKDGMRNGHSVWNDFVIRWQWHGQRGAKEKVFIMNTAVNYSLFLSRPASIGSFWRNSHSKKEQIIEEVGVFCTDYPDNGINPNCQFSYPVPILTSQVLCIWL